MAILCGRARKIAGVRLEASSYCGRYRSIQQMHVRVFAALERSGGSIAGENTSDGRRREEERRNEGSRHREVEEEDCV